MLDGCLVLVRSESLQEVFLAAPLRHAGVSVRLGASAV